MYNTIYQYGAAIVKDAQDLRDCKNRTITTAQRRSILTIEHHAKRLDYVIQALQSVPNASSQSYIQRQLQDVLTPILGAAQHLGDGLQDGLNTRQQYHLNAIRSNTAALIAMIAEPNSTTF